MNERIKEIAAQAEKYADENFKGEGFWSDAYESKLVELLVKKCADYANWYQANSKWTDIGKAIREHFGVEK